MENPENVKTEEIKLWIDFDGAAREKPVLHTNQMTLQIHEDEVYLSFFQLTPPVLMGEPEERVQLKARGSIQPDCVSRLIMQPHFLRKVVTILTEHLEKYEAGKEKDDGTTI